MSVWVFLSYRTADPFASSEAHRLRQFFESRLGEGTVFLDSQSIYAGSLWEHVLKEKVNESRVLIVMMGPDWEHQFKPVGETDYVQFEIETALESNKLIIPYLVGRQELPDPSPTNPFLQKLLAFQEHLSDPANYDEAALRLLEAILRDDRVFPSYLGDMRQRCLEALAAHDWILARRLVGFIPHAAFEKAEPVAGLLAGLLHLGQMSPKDIGEPDTLELRKKFGLVVACGDSKDKGLAYLATAALKTTYYKDHGMYVDGESIESLLAKGMDLSPREERKTLLRILAHMRNDATEFIRMKSL